jgi:hypothetical protein
MLSQFNSKKLFFQKTLFTSIRQTAFWLGLLFTLISMYGCRTPAAKQMGQDLIENGSKIFQKGSQIIEEDDNKKLMEKSAPVLLAPAAIPVMINPGTSRPDSESNEQPNENMNPDSQESENPENFNPNQQESDNNEDANANDQETENRE